MQEAVVRRAHKTGANEDVSLHYAAEPGGLSEVGDQLSELSTRGSMDEDAFLAFAAKEAETAREQGSRKNRLRSLFKGEGKRHNERDSGGRDATIAVNFPDNYRVGLQSVAQGVRAVSPAVTCKVFCVRSLHGHTGWQHCSAF